MTSGKRWQRIRTIWRDFIALLLCFRSDIVIVGHITCCCYYYHIASLYAVIPLLMWAQTTHTGTSRPAHTWLWDGDVKNPLNVTTVCGDVEDSGWQCWRRANITAAAAAAAAACDVDRHHAVWQPHPRRSLIITAAAVLCQMKYLAPQSTTVATASILLLIIRIIKYTVWLRHLLIESLSYTL